MKVLYFAWLKAKTGIAEEEVTPPPTVTTVEQLIDWLAARGDGFAEALSDRRVIRAAVNQRHVALDHGIENGDEVALFPPVTGG